MGKIGSLRPMPRPGDAVTHTGRRASRLTGLDSLRALATISVMAFHYDRNIYDGKSSGFLYYGLLGAELFFVISGFVILMTIERCNTVGDFAVGRFARLFPIYWLSLVFCALGFSDAPLSWLRLLVGATMLQSFLRVPDLQAPFWTLAYELVFYVTIAAVFASRLLHRIDRLALCWLVAVGGMRSLGIHMPHMLALVTMAHFGQFFIAGMMVYRIRQGRATSLTWIVLVGSCLYSLSGRNDWATISPLIYGLVTAVFAAVVWVSAGIRALPRVMVPLVTLGMVSYPLYLLHMPAGRMAVAALGQSQPRWLPWIAALPLALGMSIAAHYLIEMPIQAAIRGAWRRRFLPVLALSSGE